MDLDLYLKQLEELVNTDSGSLYVEGICRAADKIEGWYRELGWHIKRHIAEGGRPVLEISNKKEPGSYDVMFVGHMDTVFPEGTAAERPFRIEGDYCYGPGVGDMKNGDTAMFHIAANMDRRALEELSVAMVYNPDEEIGSVYSKEILDEIGRRSRVIIVMESAGNLGARHCFNRKGSLNVRIALRGKAAHAGFIFEKENASAVLELAHMVLELSALADREKGTTVNVGKVQGGTAVNIVPDYAELSMEARFKTEEERRRISGAVKGKMRETPFIKGAARELLEFRENAPLIKTDRTERFVQGMKGLAARLSIPFEEKDRGGLSDGNHLSRCGGDPVVLDGMGPHGAEDHTEREYGYIPSVEPCVRLLCEVLREMAEQKGEGWAW